MFLGPQSTDAYTDQAEMSSFPNTVYQKGNNFPQSSFLPTLVLQLVWQGACMAHTGTVLQAACALAPHQHAARAPGPTHGAAAMPRALCSHRFTQLLLCCQPASAGLQVFFPLPSPPLLLLPRFEERAQPGLSVLGAGTAKWEWVAPAPSQAVC